MPDELINKILQAAQWAPSGGNTQRWRFLVVKDPEIKKKVQVYYKRLYDETVGPRYSSSAPPPGSDPARYQRQHVAVKYLTDHYHEAPVWIVACLEDGKTRIARPARRSIQRYRTCFWRRGRSGSVRR